MKKALKVPWYNIVIFLCALNVGIEIAKCNWTAAIGWLSASVAWISAKHAMAMLKESR